MKIAIFGLGYVGITSAGCLTNIGHDVVGIDVSPAKVDAINAGKMPIHEPELDKMIADAARDKRLTASTTIGNTLRDCDLALVCVGTPSAVDGSHNMSYIVDVTGQIARAVPVDRTRPLTVAYRSTFRPGTIEELVIPVFRRELGDKADVIELVYYPEFLREGVAVKDFFAPPKVVCGTADGRPCAAIAAINADMDCPTYFVGYREAELTKFVDNTFHALKVAFGNEIGRICLQLDIDPTTVHDIFVSDRKLNISPVYLRPGGPFGGSCLPKDVRALQSISAKAKCETPVINSLIRSNDDHKSFIADFATRELAPGGSVLLVGLAFKRDTDDLRESPGVDLAERLIEGGFDLSIYDSSLNMKMLHGQNLGFTVAHLPNLETLLLTREQAEGKYFDVVLDMNGEAADLTLDAARRVEVNKLATR